MKQETGMAFTVKHPDFEKSPLTGMTREHWVEAAKYLVDGVLQHIQSMDDPVVIPKQSDACYPQPGEPPHRFQAAEFEGLARTFMAAAPVIAENPRAESSGIR